MSKLLAHSWISAPLGAVLYLAATVFFWQKPTPAAPAAIGLHRQCRRAILEFQQSRGRPTDCGIEDRRKNRSNSASQQLDDLATRLKAERAELGQVIAIGAPIAE